MSTVQFPNIDEIEAQAASWVAIIDRGMTPLDKRSLSTWLEESPLHGETLVKCASMWELLDVLHPIAKLLPIDESLLIEDTCPEVGGDGDVHAGGAWSMPYRLALAAVFMMLVVGAVFMDTFRPQPSGLEPGFEAFPSTAQTEANAQSAQPQNERYKTQVGEISDVSLIDGSTLKLNTDSEVIVQFSQRQRQLVLVRGEVFFDVAKDSARPFVVNVGKERVTAIGTAFSIDLNHGDGTEVLVTEGKVRVNRTSQEFENRYSDVFLTPGQKVHIRDNQAEVLVGQDPETLLAWRDGIIVFEGESLEEVIREIDRYTPLSFKIVDRDIASISVGGFFRTGDLEQLLLVLEQNFGVRSSRSGKQVLLSKLHD